MDQALDTKKVDEGAIRLDRLHDAVGCGADDQALRTAFTLVLALVLSTALRETITLRAVVADLPSP